MTTAINMKKSVLAVKVEASEGTLLAPTANTEYLALQDDLEMSAAFDTIENAELRSSIGGAKPTIGVENPTAGMSHYLRHSGVEGQAPNFKNVFKAAFGTENVNGTERSTTTSSTVSLIKAAAGGGDFARGRGVLIKDPVNGSRIRPVHSVSTNDLTPGFNLPTGKAPGSGVALGKCVSYEPANEGHPTLSLWHYIGNGGGIRAVAGARVTELSFEAAVGDNINMSFGFEANEYFNNPIEITSATRYIDFEDDDGDHSAAIAIGWYKNPADLAAAAQAAMLAANGSKVPTVSYASGQFTFKTTGTVLELKWNTGTNTANTAATKFGFSAGADNTGTAATTGYTGSALTWTAPHSPVFDSADPIPGKGLELLVGDADNYLTLEPTSVSFSMQLDRRVIESLASASGRVGSLITGRTVTLSGSSPLAQHDVELFRRFIAGADTRALFNFGYKSGGNWVPGKCGYLYLPTAVLSSWDITDDDGLATIEWELTAYVDASGNGEVYMGFL